MDNYLDFKESAMTFTFDIETWFKVTKHPLPKYDSDRARGRADRMFYH